MVTLDETMRGSARWVHGHVRRGHEKLTDAVGGPARRKAILMLAAVLSLSGADVGAVGAVAPQLESGLRVGNAGIGLLVTASTLVGAIATLPFGVLADRLSRTRILSISIVVWGAVEFASAFSTTYLMLLFTRVALGVAVATAGPTVASLVGDLFGANERSRVYGMILTGELVGAGVGILVAGNVGAAVSWRVGLGLLAVPSALLAWAIHCWFPEPARGGQSRLLEGADEILPADEAPPDRDLKDRASGPDTEEHVRALVEEAEVEPDESLVLDPRKELTMLQAVRWVFRTPTNVSLIIASSLGYFYLGGLRTFALIYARGRFGIGEGIATILFLLIGVAAMAGVLVSGRSTDRLIRRGKVDARLVVGGAGFVTAALVLVPAMLARSILVGLPLFLVAAFLLSAPNPPVDAARLDVVPSHMWGRAESIRTTTRMVLEALAPLVFGVVSAILGGGSSGGLASGVNAKNAHVSEAGTVGLEYTFLVMLVFLAGSGVLLLRARRSYLTDVATAAASEKFC